MCGSKNALNSQICAYLFDDAHFVWPGHFYFAAAGAGGDAIFWFYSVIRGHPKCVDSYLLLELCMA